MVKITNKNHPYFNQDVSIVETLENDELSVFIPSEETIITIKQADIESTAKLKTPRSRKDFYIYIQNEKNSKKDIILTVKKLHELSHIKLNTLSLDNFCLHLDECISRKDIVEKIRELRDNNDIEFLLPNN